jgi:hypothetical protein
MNDHRDSRLFDLPPWTNRTRTGVLIAVVAGFVVAATVQLTVDWWLDSGRGVAVTTLASLVTTLVAFRAWHNALAFWAAMMVGNTLILFSIGPGSIFPIVIAVGGTLTGAAVAAGWGLRWGLGQAWSWAQGWLQDA